MVGAVIGEIECKLQLFGRHKEFRSRSSSETHRGLNTLRESGADFDRDSKTSHCNETRYESELRWMFC